jgi:capsular polysaccharide biosynthesis protein
LICDLPSFTIDTKIHTEEDILKQINDAAFLGTIPQVADGESCLTALIPAL